MIKLDNTAVTGWEQAIRGMRNPMNSWSMSDTERYCSKTSGCSFCTAYKIGPNDLELMKKLSKAGTDHRKFMRMIVVYVDIVAPLYWWKEFDTYKVGTVRNSCSTMHKITAKEFELDDFSHDHLTTFNLTNLVETINRLNLMRLDYLNPAANKPENEAWKKSDWYQMIQLLPSSYNQRATVMLNYEVLANMYHARKNHKLDEWHEFCDWVETLPYSEIIIGQEI